MRLRVEFVTDAPLLWHALNGPMLRGAFGTALRAIHGRGGLYERLFDDGTAAGAVRPYRIRAPHTDPHKLPKGSLVTMDLDLLNEGAAMAEALLPVFVVMAHLGLGRDPVRTTLHAVSQRLPGGDLRLVAKGLRRSSTVRRHPLKAHLPDARHGIAFLGPVRLASRGPATAPTLTELLEASARRLEGLSGDPVSVPAGDFGGVWRRVRVVRETRMSRREGAQSVSGILGELTPVGDWPPDVVSLLGAACVVGVGRHTTMGLGDCVPL